MSEYERYLGLAETCKLLAGQSVGDERLRCLYAVLKFNRLAVYFKGEVEDDGLGGIVDGKNVFRLEDFRPKRKRVSSV